MKQGFITFCFSNKHCCCCCRMDLNDDYDVIAQEENDTTTKESSTTAAAAAKFSESAAAAKPSRRSSAKPSTSSTVVVHSAVPPPPPSAMSTAWQTAAAIESSCQSYYRAPSLQHLSPMAPTVTTISQSPEDLYKVKKTAPFSHECKLLGSIAVMLLAVMRVCNTHYSRK